MTVEQFTINEIATLLRVSRQTIVRLIKTGKIRAARIGCAYRVAKGDLEAYYKSTGGGELFTTETDGSKS